MKENTTVKIRQQNTLQKTVLSLTIAQNEKNQQMEYKSIWLQVRNQKCVCDK